MNLTVPKVNAIDGKEKGNELHVIQQRGVGCGGGHAESAAQSRVALI